MPDFDPLAPLRKLYRHPISTLAVLADHRGAISGGQSVEAFFPGKGTGPDSDFDVYLPRNPDAIMDTMHLLRLAGITWKSAISGILDDIQEFKSAILPAKTLFCMARELFIRPENLEAYIKSRFVGDGNCVKFAKSLASGLTDAYGREMDSLREKRRSCELEEDDLWHYDSRNGRGTFVFLRRTFEDCTSDLLEPLKPLPKRTCREKIKKQKQEWKKHQLPVALFWRHLLKRLRTFEMPDEWKTEGCTRKEDRIQYIVDNFFPGKRPKTRSGRAKKVGKTKNKNTKEPDLVYPDFDFQMLQGILEDGTKVQLMLLPPNDSILHAVLKFYATNLMSFIGGIFAAHLYHDTAKHHISYEMDISEDKYKHKHSFRGKGKYRKRGWKFQKFPRNKENLRCGGDKKVKIVDFEQIYLSALQAQRGDAQDITKGVKDYFRRRKSAFSVSNWTERERKIERINYVDYEGDKGANHQPAGVLTWVHDALNGHKDVTPKSVWDNREELQFVLLDLWFGGARASAIHTGYLLQNLSFENLSFEEYNLPDSDQESCSDETSEEHNLSGSDLESGSDETLVSDNCSQ
jgi:hypothetical protein